LSWCPACPVLRANEGKADIGPLAVIVPRPVRQLSDQDLDSGHRRNDGGVPAERPPPAVQKSRLNAQIIRSSNALPGQEVAGGGCKNAKLKTCRPCATNIGCPADQHQAMKRDRETATSNHQSLSNFIWSVADLFRGDYKQSEYGRVILPFTVLRRHRLGRLIPARGDVFALPFVL
jgi:hypothetical protein